MNWQTRLIEFHHQLDYYRLLQIGLRSGPRNLDTWRTWRIQVRASACVSSNLSGRWDHGEAEGNESQVGTEALHCKRKDTMESSSLVELSTYFCRFCNPKAAKRTYRCARWSYESFLFLCFVFIWLLGCMPRRSQVSERSWRSENETTPHSSCLAQQGSIFMKLCRQGSAVSRVFSGFHLQKVGFAHDILWFWESRITLTGWLHKVGLNGGCNPKLKWDP